MVPWPTPQDYNEAIQNPRFAFSDPDLQQALCEVTTLGLPKPVTGNFASVYRMRCAGRDWAVRCFWRELADMEQRYRAIGVHLAAVNLPYTVGFDYQPQGMRVRGRWYPILKMEWIEGELLNDYLAKHRSDPQAVETLLTGWIKLVRDLERSGCAHGDLQHGNILVVGRELKLVDYDGMFVPALAGLYSHELGQQHYQHPGRGARDFGPQLDRFSSWVIYLSILAMQRDPSLWDITRAGDERLLLQRRDYDDPSTSPTLAILTQHVDDELQTAARRFRALLDEPLPAVPPLSTILPGSSNLGDADQRRRFGLAARLKLRWRCVAPTVKHSREGDANPAGTHPTWVVDHLSLQRIEAPSIALAAITRTRRFILAVLALAATSAAGFILTGVPPAIAVVMPFVACVGIAFAICVLAYRGQPAVQRLLPAVRSEARALRRLAGGERSAKRIARERQRVERRMEDARAEVRRQQAALDKEETVRLDRVRRRHTAALASLETRRSRIEARATGATAMALEEVQSRYLADTLRRATLWKASLPGLGPSEKVHLWVHGIWAAADVSSERMITLCRSKAMYVTVLVAWRLEVEATARSSMPRQLSRNERPQVVRRCSRKREAVTLSIRREEDAYQEALSEVDATIGQRRAQLEAALGARTKAHALRLAALKTQRESILELERSQWQCVREARRTLAQAAEISFPHFVRAVCFPWWRSDSE